MMKVMRGYFAQLVHEEMQRNPKVWVIVGDMGYKMWDAIEQDFPERYINTGAAEQSMMGLAVGLAMEGYIPLVYSITPFLLYRPFETIRNYINYERIPVKLIGGGRGKEYGANGMSHWAHEDTKVMKLFPHIKTYWPEDNTALKRNFKSMLTNEKPTYLNLKR